MFWYVVLVVNETAYYTPAQSEASACVLCAVMIEQWIDKGYQPDQRNRWFTLTRKKEVVNVAVINRSLPVQNLTIHLEEPIP